MEIDALYQMVGEKVRSNRERSGSRMSQAALAAKVGVTRASIVNIEAGRQKAPLHLLWRIAEALGTEVALLIPKQSELLETSVPIKLDEESVNMIEHAANGDLHTKRLLTQFVSKAKSQLQ